MPRNRRLVIRYPVFNEYRIIVIQCGNIERTGRRLNADIDGCQAAWIGVVGRMYSYLLFRTNEADPDTIAHEASHAIRGMFDSVGVVGKQDDETFAYHLGHLVGKLHKFLR